MVQVIIFFAVFTIAFTAPALDESRNILRENIDLSSTYFSEDELNEAFNRAVDKMSHDNHNIGEANVLKIKTNEIEAGNHMNSTNEEVEYNLIGIDDRNKTLDAFMSVLIEFIQSITNNVDLQALVGRKNLTMT